MLFHYQFLLNYQILSFSESKIYSIAIIIDPSNILKYHYDSNCEVSRFKNSFENFKLFIINMKVV